MRFATPLTGRLCSYKLNNPVTARCSESSTRVRVFRQSFAIRWGDAGGVERAIFGQHRAESDASQSTGGGGEVDDFAEFIAMRIYSEHVGGEVSYL